MKHLVFALVIVTLAPSVALADRTPTRAEWDAAARQYAARVCIKREKRSPTILESSIHVYACVRRGARGPAGERWRVLRRKPHGEMLQRTLENDHALGRGDFTLHWNYGKRVGLDYWWVTDSMPMFVHHYVWRTRRGPHGTHVRKEFPVIKIREPVFWVNTGVFGTIGRVLGPTASLLLEPTGGM